MHGLLLLKCLPSSMAPRLKRIIGGRILPRAMGDACCQEWRSASMCSAAFNQRLKPRQQ